MSRFLTSELFIFFLILIGIVLKMLPALLAIVRNYVPYVTLPISIAIGIIGYNIEGLISDKSTPTKKLSIEDERLERQLKEMDKKDLSTNTLKSKSFVPKTVFEKNLSS
ncbi:hypothetical protein JTE90_021542 [Oedothorax gibbosus]|uniref:Uncharacterized protein n=1 Tax=Oedothorax gibbosus TaxID=931172 RepID=A0AAV6VRA9_9ARAC|nr:hypothetical protein JTE90_021542 [Oedothorax gibbosus]